MAPSWPPNSNKHRLKIDAKIYQKFDASWNRCLQKLGRILEAKMEPCWHPNRSKIYATCEKRIFETSLCFLRKKNIFFEGSGVQIGNKNRLKIDQKIEHGKASWHRFWNDFEEF